MNPLALTVILAADGSLRAAGKLSPAVGVALALAAALLSFALYRRETRGLGGAIRWALPGLRTAAIVLVILMLVGPVWLHRREVGTRGEVTFVIDSSASMEIADVPGSKNRLSAIWETLGVDPEPVDVNAAASPENNADPEEIARDAAAAGLLANLRETHRVRVMTSPADFPATDLAALLSRADNAGTMDAPTKLTPEANPLRSVVLFSDGQNNRGESPSEAAAALAARGIGVATVGVGAPREPTSLAILDLRHPDRIDASDVVRGYLDYKRVLPGDQEVTVQIRGADGRPVWEGTIGPEAPPRGRVNFDFPAKDLPAESDEEGERLQPDARRVRRTGRVVTLTAQLQWPAASEATVVDTGQARRDFALSIDQSSYRLLILDGRSRWETRYLRNVFERDPRWQVNTVLAGPATSHPRGVPRGSQPGEVPRQLHELSDYELIIVGEVPPDLLTADLQEMLVAYVDRGGAVVLIDGVRRHLRAQSQQPLDQLVPVRWNPGERVLKTEQISRTEVGAETAWLQLEGSAAASLFGGVTPRRWEQLPAPRTLQLTEAKTDAEVLLEAELGSLRFPLLVHRMFGGGHVVYLASDETWRWRYGVADAVHAKFWNQLALGIMPPQLAVENDVAGLDSGGPAYTDDEPVPLQVRLRNPDGSFADQRNVRVELLRDGAVVQSVPLESQGRVPGLYQAAAAPLPPGTYQARISAAGYGDALDELQTRFTVAPARSQELLRLSLNESLLREIAAAGEGSYVRLASAEQLLDYLQPRTRGRIVESETSLWDSYFWFLPLVALLCLEWWFRKRVGLP